MKFCRHCGINKVPDRQGESCATCVRYETLLDSMFCVICGAKGCARWDFVNGASCYRHPVRAESFLLD